MPIIKPYELNGFEFTLTTINVDIEIMLNIGDAKIAQAIVERNPTFLSALEKLANDYDEIRSVLLAEESLGMWFQCSYAENRDEELHRLLNSEYASDRLKEKVLVELGYMPPPEYVKPERKKKSGYIYLVRANTGEYKIGYSADVQNRIKAFAVHPAFEYELIHTFPTDDMVETESFLHNKFSDKRIKGEWFSLSIEDVGEILRLRGYENGCFLSDEHAPNNSFNRSAN